MKHLFVMTYLHQNGSILTKDSPFNNCRVAAVVAAVTQPNINDGSTSANFWWRVNKMVNPYNGPAAKLLTPPTLNLVKMTITSHYIVIQSLPKIAYVNPGTSWKSYLTPNCSLSPNFTGPCASKILIVWWLLMKEMWPAGHNYDLLVTSETSWTISDYKFIQEIGHCWLLDLSQDFWFYFQTFLQTWSGARCWIYPVSSLQSPCFV